MIYPSGDFDPSAFLPEPAAEKGTSPLRQIHARQPHLGYAVLAILIGYLALRAATAIVFAAGSLAEFTTKLATGRILQLLPNLKDLTPERMPGVTVLVEALSYVLALAVLLPLCKALWRRSFADVLQVHLPTARRFAGKLALLGVVVAIAAQFVESHMTLPKEMPLDTFFRSPGTIWLVAVFGTLIAPVTEELLFRGFLLSGVAIAYDQIAHVWTAAGRERWRETDDVSRPAWIFSAILTSLLFGLVHASQLGFAWNAVAVLSAVGGILCAVRLRLKSLAASAVVHVAYNGFIFVVLFIATDGFRHLDKMHGR